MAAITTIKPRGIDITGDYVVNSLSSTGNVTAANIKTDHLLYANGTAYVFTTNAAGANTQIQFNDGNSFAGNANLTFNKTTGTLTVSYLSGDGSNVANVNAATLNGHSDTYFASTSYVDDAIGNLVDGAPALLDTLNELANALGNDASFTTSITNSLANKANISSLSNVATSGSYADLTNLPSLFDGEYSSLANTPSLFSGEYVDLANKPSLFSGSYLDLTNTPSLFDGEYASLANKPSLFSGSYLDLTNTPTLFDGEYSSLANTPTLSNVATSGDYTDLINTPTLFDGEYSSLANAPALFSGSYLDLTNLPTLGTAASTNANAYATAAQGTLADSALQPSDLTGYATETYVGNAIADLVNSAPTALDTLNELANALGNDASFSTSITNSLANKLSTSDFSSTANTWVATISTSLLSEGTNLYYTVTRANTAIDNRVTQSFVNALDITSNTANIAYGFSGSLSNISITGGNSGQVLSTDGTGNLSWTDSSGSAGALVSVDSFLADGSNSSFTLATTPENENYTLVNINGTSQLKGAYSLSGNVITFSEAPPANVNIEVTTITKGTGGSSGTGSTGYTYEEATANTALAIGKRYIVDSSSANLTLTLPSTATLGDEIGVIDGTGTASSHTITIARNGSNIQGAASDMTVSTDRAAFVLVYYNSTQGWLLTQI